MVKGWHKPLSNGPMHQKIYGRKVGHVVQTGKFFFARFDGLVVGVYEDEEEAKRKVDVYAANKGAM